MTPEERKAAAEVMASNGPWDYAGYDAPDSWYPTDNPTWDWVHLKFRVRPKPIVRYLVWRKNSKGTPFLSAETESSDMVSQDSPIPLYAVRRVEITEGQFDE